MVRYGTHGLNILNGMKALELEVSYWAGEILSE